MFGVKEMCVLLELYAALDPEREHIPTCCTSAKAAACLQSSECEQDTSREEARHWQFRVPIYNLSSIIKYNSLSIRLLDNLRVQLHTSDMSQFNPLSSVTC